MVGIDLVEEFYLLENLLLECCTFDADSIIVIIIIIVVVVAALVVTVRWGLFGRGSSRIEGRIVGKP